MPDNIENVIVTGTKRIIELQTLAKLTGKEEVLIDNGDETYKITVDSLLGYIANQINAGTYPPSVTDTTNIIVIPEGADMPVSERVEGNFYIKITDTVDASIVGGLTSRIRVSPNMGLKVIND